MTKLLRSLKLLRVLSSRNRWRFDAEARFAIAPSCILRRVPPISSVASGIHSFLRQSA